MHSPCFHIFRHRNGVLVDQFMKHHIENLDPNKNLANQQSIQANHLKAMKFLAMARETADRSNMSFFGSFVTADGHHYSITNINEDEIEQKTIQYLIDFKLSETFDLNAIQKNLKIVSTDEGIQLQISDSSS
jgi:uncharacterized protein (DUF1015 family)